MVNVKRFPRRSYRRHIHRCIWLQIRWRSIGKCRVWPVVVVVVQPDSQLAAGIGETEEHLHVQALVTQLPVEALDVAVFDRSPWPDEVQMYSVQ